MPGIDYVHGYSGVENRRLSDQAITLSQLLHHDSIFPPGSRILEAGCGVGAQTVVLAPQNPQCAFTSIDISPQSLRAAGRLMKRNGIGNVRFQTADIFNLSFEDETFDHVLVCFVLEHIAHPLKALKSLKRVLRHGGSITVIEGDHGSAYYHPKSKAAQAAIQCLIDIQASLGGNSLIGRELYHLLMSAGFKNCSVSPRMVCADSSRPEMVDGFTRKTFTAMVKGVRHQALSQGLIDAETWKKGIRDLYRTAGKNGTFCYTFFKATAIK
jgi:ubiquinone/menaquinone biosynthesis C-methylase UbiE